MNTINEKTCEMIMPATGQPCGKAAWWVRRERNEWFCEDHSFTLAQAGFKVISCWKEWKANSVTNSKP